MVVGLPARLREAAEAGRLGPDDWIRLPVLTRAQAQRDNDRLKTTDIRRSTAPPGG